MHLPYMHIHQVIVKPEGFAEQPGRMHVRAICVRVWTFTKTSMPSSMNDVWTLPRSVHTLSDVMYCSMARSPCAEDVTKAGICAITIHLDRLIFSTLPS